MIKREPFYSKRIPHRVGCVVDWPLGAAVRKDFTDVLRFLLDEATASKRLDRPIELVVREVPAAPLADARHAVNAWRSLAFDEEVQLVIGPHSDDAAIAVAQAMRSAPHPTLSACATSRFSCDFGVTLGLGNAADEGVLLARLHVGHARVVGVLCEQSPYGEEAADSFARHAFEAGVTTAATLPLAALPEAADVLAKLLRLKPLGVTTVQVLAGPAALPAIADAANRAASDGFKPDYCVGSAFASRHGVDGLDAKRLQGWTGIEVFDPDNRVAKDFLDRFEKAEGRRPAHAHALVAHDLAQVAIQTLATAKPHHAPVIRTTMERIRFWPAAAGKSDTLISIAPHDHRAYKGTPFFVSGTTAAPPSTPARNATRVTRAGAEPYRIGVIEDWMLGTQSWFDQFDMTRFAFDEAYESGLLDRPVELVVREIEGPPWGHVEPILRAHRELATSQGCLAIIGPHITDDTRSARTQVDALRVPTITYCATLHAASDYFFQLPNGTFADETGYIARHLAARGAKKLGILREDNVISDEYNDFLRMYCKRLGIGVASDQVIHGFADVDEITARLQLIRESGADAIAYLAFGATAYNVLVKGNEALKNWGWNPHRVTITTWVGVTCPGFTYFPIDMADPKHHPLLEGWVGVDQTHEANPHWGAVRERFAARHDGRKPFHCYAALGYDMAHTIALALSRADEKTPEGVKRALETIRLLPAASGGPGTVISFAPHDRRGLKGAEYLVLRTVRDGREQLA